MNRMTIAFDHSPKGEKISNDQMADLNLKLEKFHGDWNYTIYPNQKHR